MSYINDTVEETIRFLPNIRPLTEFLHLNMLPGLTSEPFWKAMQDSSTKYSFIPFLPISYYQERYAKGDIDRGLLERELAEKNLSLDVLFRKPLDIHFPEKSYRPLHQIINQRLEQSISEITESLLVRILSHYYDQGFSLFPMPHNENGLLATFFDLVFKSYINLDPLDKKDISFYQNKDAQDIVDIILSEMFDEESLKKLYIEECFLSLKGWSGFILSVDREPYLLLDSKKGTLIEMLALRLMIESSWIKKIHGKNIRILKNDIAPDRLLKNPMFSQEDWTALEVWHEAFEKTYYKNILKNISAFSPKIKKKDYLIQAIFCIDDRECALRRFLEDIDEEIETFSTPGHFGLDFYYKETEHSYPQKHCPAPVNASFLIQKKRGEVTQKTRKFKWQQRKNHSVFHELVNTFFDGIKLSLLFVKDVVFPSSAKNVTATSVNESDLVFKLFRATDTEKMHDKFLGYTKEEAALRLANVLKSIGLVNHFSKVVFIVGHGSTTSNNPYFSAYGCGACSGRTGNINSIVFSSLAQDEEVQNILREKYGIDIPRETTFLPAMHDTTKDTFTFYGKTIEGTQDLVSRFNEVSQMALKKNAKLRCDDFELVSKQLTDDQALQETVKRALSIFEPRPELGHTKNALCIVGRRSSTRSFSFARRAFLQSYDFSIDPEGAFLNAILSAAVPVCGGINLDYFYSKMNNRGIGAGSKLSHNVVGLVALSHGTEDDLLTGLAYQMVELHEPIRIMFVIEQKVEVVEKIIRGNLGIWPWIKNSWVKFACVDPETREIHYFSDEKFSLLKEGNL